MPFSKNINTYHDVVQVLATARREGGLTYTLPSNGAATNWVARAYHYRKLLTDTARRRAGNVPGFVPTTEWDDMLLTRDGKAVRIEFGKVKGTLTTADGREVQPIEIPIESGAAERIISTVPVAERKPVDDDGPTIDLDELEASARALMERNAK